ncbi:maleylpyruvate isomerase family mycothiol-dependent enzyme [Actinoplanes sp. HUAS TT8]|uniref:maleylpyruvate isomerase family mycothiol-dependent enzyme n=1 Tax=Actinoplanes sp. HUAS TT8 TaxID=3447453 RepID=UPI003F52906A
MEWLSAERYLSAMESETGRLVAAVGRRDPHEPVPSCPDWSVRDLVTHVGTGHRLSAAVVRAKASKPAPYELIQAPEDFGPWLAEGAGELVTAVREQGFDTEVWAWVPQHQTTGFWLRRMLHDLIIHRFDVDPDGDLDEDLAVDGVADILLCYATLSAREPSPMAGLRGRGETLQFGDGVHGWHVTLTPGGAQWRPGVAAADVELTAPARELLLVLNRRREPGECRGDRALLDRWVQNTRF